MQRILEHINTFTELMKKKGYEGNFHSSFGFYDTLKDNLIKHVFQCYEEKRSIGPLNLTTYSHWTDSKGPYVRCNFYTDYREPKGFGVIKMNIQYGYQYGPVRNKELPMRDNSEIPHRDQANALVMENNRGLKV